MSKYEREPEENYVYDGPSVVEIRDEEGNILVRPTDCSTHVDSSHLTLKFIDGAGNVIGSTEGIPKYDW